MDYSERIIQLEAENADLKDKLDIEEAMYNQLEIDTLEIKAKLEAAEARVKLIEEVWD